jgi:Tfp pilus assembly protein PilN
MRAVNLIPPESRGERKPARTGGLPYVVLAGLALALAGATIVVMTGNTINDKKAEVATLQARQTQLQGEIARVQSYADLATLEQTRVATVTSLAQSRFDWPRTLRELALLIPNDVWLTDLEGTVSPGVSVGGASGGGGSSLREQVLGPALTMDGCASSHDAVAGFLDVLRDMDGVTRVAVTNSDRGGSSSSSGGSTASCAVRDFITQFSIIVAFDPVAVPVATPAPTSGIAAAGGDDTVAQGQAQEQQARDSSSKASTRAHDAVSAIVPGTVGP